MLRGFKYTWKKTDILLSLRKTVLRGNRSTLVWYYLEQRTWLAQRPVTQGRCHRKVEVAVDRLRMRVLIPLLTTRCSGIAFSKVERASPQNHLVQNSRGRGRLAQEFALSLTKGWMPTIFKYMLNIEGFVKKIIQFVQFLSN